MKTALIKKGEKSYLELPHEFNDVEAAELFQLRDGFYLLTIPLEKKARPTVKEELSELEKAVLAKLLSIKFEERTISKVQKEFTQQEKNVLAGLERRGLVNIFFGKKYQKTGVYNIKDSIYPQVSHYMKDKAQQQFEARDENSFYGELFRNGFMIITDPMKAVAFSHVLRKDMRAGEVIGVRGFDGKFYVATKHYFYRVFPLIKNVMSEEMHFSEIAKAIKESEDGCLVVLHLAAEKGEVLEKKKGIFALT